MTSDRPLAPPPFSCIVLALAATLVACAPATRVTLLPQPGGAASAVEVRSASGSQRISEPYQVATVSRRGEAALETTTAEQVRETYPRLLALQPPEPERFVLQFEPGRSQLTDESQVQLATVLSTAWARAGGEIVVTGHTDRQGSEEANDRLSLARAQAVRDLLVARGFRPELIEARGRGEREPLVATDDDVAEPLNRRVEVVVR